MLHLLVIITMINLFSMIFVNSTQYLNMTFSATENATFTKSMISSDNKSSSWLLTNQPLSAFNVNRSASMSETLGSMQKEFPQISNLSTINPEKINFSTYENTDLGISFMYPSTWQLIKNESNITVFSPLESHDDLFKEFFQIQVLSSEFTSLESIASIQINELKNNKPSVKIINSSIIGPLKSPVYMIEYVYDDILSHEVAQYWTEINGKTFVFSLTTEIKNFESFSKILHKILSSLKITEKGKQTSQDLQNPEWELPGDPYAIDFNPSMGTMYITNLGSSLLSVVDSVQDRLFQNITVGIHPADVKVNPITNKIYVANYGSHTVSIIDGSTNKLETSIPVGNNPNGIALDYREGGIQSLLFIIYEFGNNVTVIDGSTNKVRTNLPVGKNPSSIEINEVTNRLYVSDKDSRSLFIFDYFNFKNGSFIMNQVNKISIGDFPTSMALNSNTNTLYVTDSKTDYVYALKGSNGSVISKIKVESRPEGIEVNPITNKIYVANYGSHTVSIIDGSTNKLETSIPVGNNPVDLSYNPNTDLMYVTNLGSDSISELNSKNKVVAGVHFNVNPPESGSIECNKKIVSEPYLRYEKGKVLECRAIPNWGFSFSSWNSNIAGMAQNNPTRFNLTDHGTIEANFGIPVNLNIPPEYYIAFLGILTGPLIIPPIIKWFVYRKQKATLTRVLEIMEGKLGTLYGDKDQRYLQIHQFRRDMELLYIQGKISEHHYLLLKERLSKYETNAFKGEAS